MPEARKTFDEQLQELRNDVIRAAAVVGEAITAATQALLGDLGVVDQVIADDAIVDDLNHSMEMRAFEIMALQQPTAVDLRTLLSILRIVHELELSGDLMVTTAKAARRLYPKELPPRVRGLIDRMGAQATVQLRVAVDAFADADTTKAVALPDMDDVMDDLQKEMFRAIFSQGAPDEDALQLAVQLALIGRYYERLADHAVQIGAWVHFMVTGELPGPESPSALEMATSDEPRPTA
ncbi:MAG: phosphate signaling complex protein PhoU [Acidimicrobiia bacterium]|nr:phosphate signaling complex protein PhoU [Acidimicrobiia bacterium]